MDLPTAILRADDSAEARRVVPAAVTILERELRRARLACGSATERNFKRKNSRRGWPRGCNTAGVASNKRSARRDADSARGIATVDDAFDGDATSASRRRASRPVGDSVELRDPNGKHARPPRPVPRVRLRDAVDAERLARAAPHRRRLSVSQRACLGSSSNTTMSTMRHPRHTRCVRGRWRPAVLLSSLRRLLHLPAIGPWISRRRPRARRTNAS